MKIINNLGQENHYAFFSSIFRVFLSIHLLVDVLFQWQYIPLLYGNESFYSGDPTYILEMAGIDTSLIRDNINLFIGLYILFLLFLLFGIGKNFSVVIIFIFYENLQRLCPLILNGGDNLLKYCILYMIFIDSFKFFCYKNKKTERSDENFLIKNLLSNLGGLSVCIHICLVYFISAIHKIHSDVWFNGVATYYTLSLERFNGTSFNQYLARSGTFVTISTYFTLLIEITYPTLIWFRQTKYFLIFGAITMHSFIYILMMIYDFQIVFIMVQGFFIPNSLWLKINSWVNNKFLKCRLLNLNKGL